MAAPAATGLPIANERGERLLAFHPAGHARAPGVPTFSLVLATCSRGRILLVRNRRRGVWELPGGWIDPGESARGCALRELQEESGCRAGTPVVVGWIKLDAAGAGERVRSIGAIFSARVEGGPSLGASDEIAATALWPIDALPPGTSAIDAWLVARVMALR